MVSYNNSTRCKHTSDSGWRGASGGEGYGGQQPQLSWCQLWGGSRTDFPPNPQTCPCRCLTVKLFPAMSCSHSGAVGAGHTGVAADRCVYPRIRQQSPPVLTHLCSYAAWDEGLSVPPCRTLDTRLLWSEPSSTCRARFLEESELPPNDNRCVSLAPLPAPPLRGAPEVASTSTASAHHRCEGFQHCGGRGEGSAQWCGALDGAAPYLLPLPAASGGRPGWPACPTPRTQRPLLSSKY